MIRLTREVRAAIGQSQRDEHVRNAWAGWPTAIDFSPFIVARVTVAGQPHPLTGYLCDIKTLDDLVRSQVLPILDDLATSSAIPRSIALVLFKIARNLDAHAPLGTTWEEIEIFATPYARFAIRKELPPMVRYTEQFEFSASHRLHCAELSEDENRKTFGKCNNPSGHGHNYVVEVTIDGTPDPKTGMLLPPGRLQEVVNENVIKRFDHKHLNADTEEFQNLNPSVENIASIAWHRLKGKLDPARLVRVRIYETAKTWVDYEGE